MVRDDIIGNGPLHMRSPGHHSWLIWLPSQPGLYGRKHRLRYKLPPVFCTRERRIQENDNGYIHQMND